ncbi:Glycosyltransferase, partial [Dysosmobacter welbionis]
VEPGSQVDHIAGGSATEAVEIFLVQLHAGIFVIVKGAADHAAPFDLNPISFCGLPNGDRLLDRFKKIVHIYSLSAFLTGGLYPAALARSLAALRRSALYGSRTDTQRLGTVKLCLSFLQTCSGC